jgi:hypothetical protein
MFVRSKKRPQVAQQSIAQVTTALTLFFNTKKRGPKSSFLIMNNF